MLAALWPSRSGARREYSRVLAQRNALLARIRSGRGSASALATWDRELAIKALELSSHRAEAIELAPRALRHPSAPARSAPARLASSTAHALGQQDEEEFIAELQARLPSDLERGFSGHGPHRDELAIVRDGRELRVYGSQGEQRLALLALLLAERATIADARRQTPLMLLDDVMSELDGERRALSGGGALQRRAERDRHDRSRPRSRRLRSATARLRISPGVIMQEALAA